ncbi:MAG: Sec1-like syntaxin-binding protein [Amphiamblys sp. WSBS2006]|nr:MAG: Sec1-like syntaxin-binding protein [Amphiamblys sp. WSBS2006]
MSVRERISERIIREFSGIKVPYKILVLDETTKRILDTCTDMNAVFDAGIYNVENISKKRQSYSYMDAVYFVSPCESSINAIIADFAVKKTYSAAHVLLTAHAGDELFQKLSSSRAAGEIKTFRELYVEFLGIEQRGFQTSLEDEAKSGRGGLSGVSPGEAEEIAKRLCSFCVTMDEFPTIRYTNLPGTPTKQIGEALEKSLQGYRESDKVFGAKSRGTLLILDRRADLVSLLLHEFTYQAMVQDLLPVTRANRYAHKEKTVALDEDDAMWCTLRHKHIAQCKDELDLQIKKFMTENKAAAQKSQTGEQKEKSLEEMKELVSSLPKYHEMKEAFGLHMSLAVECIKRLNEKKLDEVGSLEQTMATGTDADGKRRGVSLEELFPFLRRASLSEKDKVRLILLYGVTQESRSGEIESACREASLGGDIASGVRKVIDHRELVLQLRDSVMSRRKKKKQGGFLGLFGGRQDDDRYELSRYETLLKGIFEVYAEGKLDEEVFPYLNSRRVFSGEGKAASLRKGHTPKKKPETEELLVVFVVGGVSYSELRDAYFMAETTGVECIVGGLGIERPEEFCENFNWK